MTLIEAMITISVLLVGLLALSSLQVTAVSTSHLGSKIAQATAIANDFAGNVSAWDYADGRLTSRATYTSFSNPALIAGWDMGRFSTASSQAQYSDAAPDTNALSTGALDGGFQGMTTDLDGDNKPDFTRYWNVYAIDLTNSGTPNGKLVQITVRWHEGSSGYHQISTSAFKVNPASVLR